MFRIINNIIDRCFFTVTFILGVQLPELIIQYQHRLSGHLTEAKLHLFQFQTIADRHFQGDLSAMVIKYQENTEPSIVSTANIINQVITRVDYLQQQLSIITESSYIEQVINTIMYADRIIIRQTIIEFSMAIPLSLNALTTGAVFAIAGLLIKETLSYVIRCITKKLWPELSSPH
ncbi:MAG: DUF2937 family protein [Colwellia sp.]|nr:DUF2937 family protein [Colwellia sp.]